MRKLLFSMIIMACAASFSFAQSDDYNKVDIYAGFSHARVDFGGDFEGFNGVEGAVTGNISRYIGLKGDYAFHRKNFDFLPGVDVEARTHTLVGGVQFKDNSKETKLKPFGHVMAGFTHAKVDLILLLRDVSGVSAVVNSQKPVSLVSSAAAWTSRLVRVSTSVRFSWITIRLVSAEKLSTTSASVSASFSDKS